MKIAIIGAAYPFRGGLAAYNERLAKELVKQGFLVNIHTFTVQYPGFLFPVKSQLSEESPPQNLNINRCIHSMNPFNWILIGNRLKKEKPDVVIIKYWLPFMGPCFGTILRRIKRNGHTKVISIVDNIIPHEKRVGDRMFTRYFFKPVDAFIAMSQNVLDEINQFDSVKPKELTPHPLSDNFGQKISKTSALEHLGLSTDDRYILFFGLIRKYKGLDLLIEAFADARLRDQKLKLIIAGEYSSDRQQYKDLIRHYSLENHIIEADKFITDSEVKYYFCGADLVVQPYRSATQSGVTQIAYHFNTPMIVTSTGGLSELCPNGKVGFVVSPEPTFIADAIDTFFQEQKHDEFAANIEREKKKFNWGVLVCHLNGLYIKLLLS